MNVDYSPLKYETTFIRKNGGRGSFLHRNSCLLFAENYESYVTIDRETGEVVSHKDGFRILMNLLAQREE